MVRTYLPLRDLGGFRTIRELVQEWYDRSCTGEVRSGTKTPVTRLRTKTRVKGRADCFISFLKFHGGLGSRFFIEFRRLASIERRAARMQHRQQQQQPQAHVDDPPVRAADLAGIRDSALEAGAAADDVPGAAKPPASCSAPDVHTGPPANKAKLLHVTWPQGVAVLYCTVLCCTVLCCAVL